MALGHIKTFEKFSEAALKSNFNRHEELPEVLHIPPSELLINDDYQRDISRRGAVVIAKIIRDFDWHRFGVLTVAKLDGETGYAVIDGQHRAIAALHLGLQKVPAIIREQATQDQAATFLAVNTNRTTVGPIDKFRARVASGEDFATALHKALDVLEIKLVTATGYDLKTKECRSIGALSTICKKFGIGTMQTALEMLMDSQPDVPNTLSNFNMHVTVRVVDRVINCDGDINRLQNVLENTVLEEVYENARQLRKMLGGQNFDLGAKLLMRAYNKNLQTKLSEDF